MAAGGVTDDAWFVARTAGSPDALRERAASFFASSDDTVRIPDFTRVEGAIILTLNPTWRAQLNIENLFDQKYYSTADGNNNITPGSPRVFRLQATARF